MIKETLSKYLYNNKSIKFAYLFGSYFDNTFTNESDVDLALYLEDKSLDNQLQLTYELSKLLKKDIDLIVLNNIKNIYLLENILNKNIILKDSEERIDFEIIKEHDILDYKAFRKYVDAA